jgi:hypothetical protein
VAASSPTIRPSKRQGSASESGRSISSLLFALQPELDQAADGVGTAEALVNRTLTDFVPNSTEEHLQNIGRTMSAYRAHKVWKFNGLALTGP